MAASQDQPRLLCIWVKSTPQGQFAALAFIDFLSQAENVEKPGVMDVLEEDIYDKKTEHLDGLVHALRIPQLGERAKFILLKLAPNSAIARGKLVPLLQEPDVQQVFEDIVEHHPCRHVKRDTQDDLAKALKMRVKKIQ